MKKAVLRKVPFLLAAVFIAQAAWGQVAFAKHDLMPGKWWMMPRVADTLNLTEEEKAKLDQLFLDKQSAMIDIKARVDKEQLALESILGREPLDEAAASTQFSRVLAARDELAGLRFQFLVGSRKVLGAERFQQLTSIFEEFKERFRSWKDRRDGDGGGSGR